MGKKKNDHANIWDVILKVVDLLYILLALDKLVGASLFGFICILLIIVGKSSSSAINEMFNNICDTIEAGLGNASIYSSVVTTVLLFSIAGNIIQYKIYPKEIKRVVLARKRAIHGRRTKQMEKLKRHNSSD